jgi:DegV family protein with EDD domain
LSIKIITDSTSDISQKQAKELGITVLPLRVIFKDGEYADGIDLLIEEFYDKLVKAETLPTTSQLVPDQFMPYFESAKQNKDTVLVITLSAELSGTYQSAVIAKDICDYDGIHIIDSLNVTLGLQILVKSAIDMLQLGLPAEEIIENLETMKHKIRLYALVENLEYLKKGGRLSGVGALAGTLLNIKPIIEVINGKVTVAAKARGMSGAYGKILKLVEQAGKIDYSKYYCVGYTGGKENLDPFLEYAKDKMDLSNAITSPIGIVVGTHAGPGVCGVAFFTKD